ncbi:hypothetical protein BJY01DRAFT_247499 [Aspergillus pseudoustus]|uniref:Uncharacterized protein n=1 Tax=Aspergillus pseudoustus TaxID=1810923 RepID=A0ABR4K3T2_9EURO
MKRFDEALVVQAVEYCILGDQSAFEALNPELASDMTYRALEDIARENWCGCGLSSTDLANTSDRCVLLTYFEL